MTAARTVARVVGEGAVGLAAARHRLDALRAAKHEAIALPAALELTPGGEVVAHTPRAPGVDLVTLLRMRDGLAAGECVTVGVAVAGGLAALHAHGLAHGDVSPANVVVSGRRAVLVDVMAGAGAGERGTPGFAAPERAVSATAAGDVFALGRVIEHIAAPEARDRVGAWVEPMTRPDPRQRPTAAECARALAACAPALAVRVPELGVASALRASARADLPATVREPSAASWRARRVAATWARRVGIGGGTVVVALGIAAWIVAPRLAPTGEPEQEPVVAFAPASSAASSLVETRVAAMGAGDGAALLATSGPTSQARDADRPLATALDAGEAGFDGLTATIVGVELVRDDGTSATARVTYALSAHAERGPEGEIEVAGEVRTDEIDLVWGPTGWTIEAIRPAT